MKIAILAPSPVPFLIGGAENLWTGWLAALNAQPDVEAELIKLPAPERDFWEIVDSYQRFAELDLSHFDRVLSGKYPAWMTAHPDHHVWMLHRLRGLYDTWPEHLPTRPADTAPTVARLTRTLAAARGARSALPDIFAALAELRTEAPQLPPSLFSLPGPLIRTLVHSLDAIGLAPQAIRRYSAISATVAARPDYFPPEAAAGIEVLHPPANPQPQSETQPGPWTGAILAPSRLDAPKRLDLVLRAYLDARLERPLVIAGDGPQRQTLETLAAGRPGVHLTGRLTDAELAAAYRQAAFTVFAPDREDYGLVALEALQAGTPVLSCTDSGGVTELVRHDDNGLIVPPDSRALATAMRRLSEDHSLRERLAARAAPSVAHIRWPALADAFTRPWRRIAVINTFPIFPPQNGGQLRMLNLYRALGRLAEVRVVNLAPAGTRAEQRPLGLGLTERLAPMSAEHAAFERELGRELRAPCGDMAAMLRPELTPDWLAAIAETARWAEVVVTCHPYAFPAIRRVWPGPVVYESLNVEADLKQAIFGHASAHVAAVRDIEGECARQAPLVTCCSAEDAERMRTLYALEREPRLVVNGVAAASYPRLDVAQREALRRRLGLTPTTAVALFVGSLHGPNIQALDALRELAVRVPDVHFCVLGSVCEAPGLATMPDNLRLLGRVSDAELRVWLAAADAGLNPVESGSGTNLKLLEYAAAGLPILTTPFGGRGGLLQPDAHYLSAELSAFDQALRALLDAPETARARAERARERAVQVGDWQRIARDYERALIDSETGER